MNKPELLPEPDLTDLRDTVKGYIDFVDRPDYHEDNDYKYYIFEAAITAMYGKEVWDWISEKMK